MALAVAPPIIKFHQGKTVLEVTAYAIEMNRTAVLIQVPGGRFSTGSYHYFPYCDEHGTTWDFMDFAACPVCQANEAQKKVDL
ncbi:MAG: hypothetical protein WA821_18545 [Anaerolineales bacterium]